MYLIELPTCNSAKCKTVFTEENYAPQPQIESASMLTDLYCVTMIHAEIQLFQGRACTNTILAKL